MTVADDSSARKAEHDQELLIRCLQAIFISHVMYSHMILFGHNSELPFFTRVAHNRRLSVSEAFSHVNDLGKRWRLCKVCWRKMRICPHNDSFSILHVFRRIHNCNKRVESNINASRR